MSRFLLHHSHEARECHVAFAAWKGFASPLRRRATIASCPSGGHEIWWQLDAASAEEALRQLPGYVADRSEAIRVDEVQIP